MPAEYPAGARAAGEEGYAELELVVDPAGEVTQAKVCESPKAFVAAATKAARRWRYSPAQLGDGPERRFRIFVRFLLKPGPLQTLSTEELVSRYLTGPRRERFEAISEIRARGTTPAIPALLEALHSEDRQTRLWALRGLAPVAGADQALPALLTLLTDPASRWQPREDSPWTLARHVASALVRLDPDTAVEALGQAIQARDQATCEVLLDALASPLSRLAPPGFAPALAGALAEPACREAALAGTWHFAADQLGPLLELIRHEDVRVRLRVLYLAWGAWPGSPPAVHERCEQITPVALGRVRDPDPGVRSEAFWLLDRCAATSALDAEALTILLETGVLDRLPLLLTRVATLLGDLGHAAHDQAPVLQRALEVAKAAEDHEATRRIQEALEAVGAGTTPDQWAQENGIVESVLRHALQRHHVKPPVRVYVHGRPASQLLRVHLAVHGYTVADEGIPGRGRGPVFEHHGRLLSYRIGPLAWRSDSEVEVRYAEVIGRGERQAVCLVRWSGARWEVTSEYVEMWVN